MVIFLLLIFAAAALAIALTAYGSFLIASGLMLTDPIDRDSRWFNPLLGGGVCVIGLTGFVGVSSLSPHPWFGTLVADHWRTLLWAGFTLPVIGVLILGVRKRSPGLVLVAMLALLLVSLLLVPPAWLWDAMYRFTGNRRFQM